MNIAEGCCCQQVYKEWSRSDVGVQGMLIALLWDTEVLVSNLGVVFIIIHHPLLSVKLLGDKGCCKP